MNKTHAPKVKRLHRQRASARTAFADYLAGAARVMSLVPSDRRTPNLLRGVRAPRILSDQEAATQTLRAIQADGKAVREDFQAAFEAAKRNLDLTGAEK